MVLAELPPNATLAEILGARAQRTPQDRLFIDIVGGVLVAAATIWARPFGWVALGAAAICFAAYGVWAIAERKLLPRAWPDELSHAAAWRAARSAAAFAGISAFVLLLFAALGIALGKIIS